MRSCDKCDGGYRTVTEGYVERLAPMPPPLDALLAAEEGGPEAYDLLVAEVEQRRAALRDSVYPCQDCNPGMFYRWAAGHFDRNHDAEHCPECIEHHKARRTSKPRPRDLVREGPTPSAGPLPPMERRDLF